MNGKVYYERIERIERSPRSQASRKLPVNSVVIMSTGHESLKLQQNAFYSTKACNDWVPPEKKYDSSKLRSKKKRIMHVLYTGLVIGENKYKSVPPRHFKFHFCT